MFFVMKLFYSRLEKKRNKKSHSTFITDKYSKLITLQIVQSVADLLVVSFPQWASSA